MTAKKYFKDINAISCLEIIIILFNISSHMEKESIDLK
jgi:hypothetical protein